MREPYYLTFFYDLFTIFRRVACKIRTGPVANRALPPQTPFWWTQGVYELLSRIRVLSVIHHSKVFKSATWVPYPYAGDPWAPLRSPGTTKEAARAWAHAGQRQGLGTRARLPLL